MKSLVVITADQIGSRRGVAPVAETLEQLRPVVHGRGARAFAQQAGDEIQGLIVSSEQAIEVVETLSRVGEWRIGVGLGSVDAPVPRDVRTANGPAFVAARRALTASRSAPQDLCVDAAVSGVREVDQLQAALWLLRTLWRRRTTAGWEAVAVVRDATDQQTAAAALGITPSALSQRLRAAGREEGAAGRRLAVILLEAARSRLDDVVGADG
ncbi:SatD family protein [Flexivirga meconopsidis]|uniref:SatD family protein n=1 Tax=Flexivirga meconopsidis TaxID=2977121 RepID=UPI0022402F55|nr:SatD family protein [Flexivirga meconopsidis]